MWQDRFFRSDLIGVALREQLTLSLGLLSALLKDKSGIRTVVAIWRSLLHDVIFFIHADDEKVRAAQRQKWVRGLRELLIQTMKWTNCSTNNFWLVSRTYNFNIVLSCKWRQMGGFISVGSFRFICWYHKSWNTTFTCAASSIPKISCQRSSARCRSGSSGFYRKAPKDQAPHVSAVAHY